MPKSYDNSFHYQSFPEDPSEVPHTPPQSTVLAPKYSPYLMGEDTTESVKSPNISHKDILIYDRSSASKEKYKKKFRDLHTRKCIPCAETLVVVILSSAIYKGSLRHDRGSYIIQNYLVFTYCLDLLYLEKKRPQK